MPRKNKQQTMQAGWLSEFIKIGISTEMPML